MRSALSLPYIPGDQASLNWLESKNFGLLRGHGFMDSVRPKFTVRFL